MNIPLDPFELELGTWAIAQQRERGRFNWHPTVERFPLAPWSRQKASSVTSKRKAAKKQQGSLGILFAAPLGPLSDHFADRSRLSRRSTIGSRVCQYLSET